MNNMFNYLKNKICFGKGILKTLQQPYKSNHNIIYKEMIKWNFSNSSYYYPYGTITNINYSTLSKEINPFQIITNNDVLKIDCNKINNDDIDIYYFGKKLENNNIITYEIKNNTKVYYLIINNKQTKKIIFYLL